MKTIDLKKAALAAGVIMTITLAACGGDGGGGGGSSTSSGPAAPTIISAAVSVDGLLAYMKVLVASVSDTTEPLDLTGFVAPTSETLEPDPSV